MIPIPGRRRSPAPPRRRCDDCGGWFYAWSGAVCANCRKAAAAALEHPSESWRASQQKASAFWKEQRDGS